MCGEMNATKPIGPELDDGDAGEQDGRREEHEPRALDAEAERPGDVVAEGQDVDPAGEDEDHRQRARRASRPAATTSSQPRPLSEPTSHTYACATSKIRPSVST